MLFNFVIMRIFLDIKLLIFRKSLYYCFSGIFNLKNDQNENTKSILTIVITLCTCGVAA